MSGSVKIIEYLCHACGQWATNVSMYGDARRKWLCPCGVKWTGGRAEEYYVMLAIEERL